jgi:hypothetical protein
MLRSQKMATFSGGLQASLVTDWFCEQLKTIKLYQLFLAADTMGALRPLEKALKKLSFLPRYKKRVFVMIGTETLDEAKERLEAVYQLGGLPFAQLYRAPTNERKEYSKEWKELVRTWSRPAAMASLHKK